MGNRQQEQVEVVCEELVRETRDAILVVYGGEEVWVPLSQVHAIHRTDPPRLMVTPWIAKQKGFG